MIPRELLSALLAICALTRAHAQGWPWDDPRPAEFAGRPQVRVDVLMCSVPQDRALALLPRLRDPATLAKAESDLLAMISAQQAQFIGWPELTAHDGAFAVTESLQENRYPSEDELPTEPQTFSGPPQTTPAKRIFNALSAAGILTPNAFESRNVGCTLEVRAAVSKDRSAATIQTAPQWIRLARIQQFRIAPRSNAAVPGLPQPQFATHKASFDATLRDGERRLIYVGKDSEAPDRIVLFILGLRILPQSSPAK